MDCTIKERLHFSCYLFWHFTDRRGGHGSQKNSRKADRRKGRFLTEPNLLSLEHVKEETKGKRGGEGNGGGGTEDSKSTTNGVENTHQLAGMHMRPGFTKPRHISGLTYEQKEGVCVWSEDEAVGAAWGDAIPPFGKSVLLGPVVFFILNWRESAGSQGLT